MATHRSVDLTRLNRLIAAAAKLGDVELRRLREAIDRLDRERRAMVLQPKDKVYKLIRLDDGEFFNYHRHSIAIQDSGWFLLTCILGRARAGEELGLAQAYLVLAEKTGPSSQFFDTYKCSFAFPFLLEPPGAAGNRGYLLEVRDYKGSLEFLVRKIVDAADPRLVERRIHEPFEHEFSRAAIDELVVYFYGYLTGYWEAIQGRAHAPFVNRVASNWIVYGYCGGSCFEEHCKSEQQYEAALTRYEQRVKMEEKRSSVGASDPV